MAVGPDELAALKQTADRYRGRDAVPADVETYLAALEAEVEEYRVLLREVAQHYHIARGHTSYSKLIAGSSRLLIDCEHDLCRYVVERTGGDRLRRGHRSPQYEEPDEM